MRYLFSIAIFVVFLNSWQIEGFAQNVTFNDANLAAKVRTALGLGTTDPILQSELETLTILSAVDAGITDLTGLEYATAMETLVLSENNISDITALGSLTAMEILVLDGNNISDITALGSLTSLRTLSLRKNSITAFTPISSLTNLRFLALEETGFSNSDISILIPLTQLTGGLALGTNRISNLQALVDVIDDYIPNLSQLFIANNRFRDITPLIDIKDQLVGLNLSGNRIINFNLLAQFTTVTDLWLQRTGISNLTPLSSLMGLRLLDLSHNPISNLEPLSSLVGLERLFIPNTHISNLEPLSSLTSLYLLRMCWNPLVPGPNMFESLKGLTEMKSFIVDSTYETQARAVFGDAVSFCGPRPEPEPVLEFKQQVLVEVKQRVSEVKQRRIIITRCGLGWAPQSQYQHFGELPKVMIYALEFEYDSDRNAGYSCKVIEIRTGDDSIENLAGWKLYLGTLYNPSYSPLKIPEEHSQITDRILRITPDMLGLETFRCSTAYLYGPSHPVPSVHYVLKTDENVVVDTAYSCFMWGQIAVTTVNGVNVKSPRRVSSAALREMETPRLERYIVNNRGTYITYMSLDEFTWDRAVLSDWLLAPSEETAPGAPSVLRRKLTTKWSALKKQ